MTNSQNKTYKWRRWLFISAVAIQLMVAIASIVLLSAVRIVVSGESLWAKGMHAAVMHLQRYATTAAPQEFIDFRNAIAIPLGVSTARQALDDGAHDISSIREGLLKGENHPDDVQTVLYALPLVWDLPALLPARTLWQQGDAYANELAQLGEAIHQRLQSSKTVANAQTVNAWLQQISQIHSTVIPLAKQFSAVLGDLFRGLSHRLLLINLATALVLSLLYLLSVQRAINESHKAHSTLEAERQRSSITLAALADGVLTLDAKQRIRYANPAASRLLDTPVGHLLGHPVAEIIPFAPSLIAQHEQASPVQGRSKAEEDQIHWIERENRDKVAVRISTTSVEDAQQRTGTVMVLHDVSQEQAYMQMLAWQQSHDMLTGLDNRTAFEKYLQQTLGKHHCTLLHLNLDHFKIINASYGHAAGDETLREVCQQLRIAVRESDVLARIGGDEFAVMLNHCQPHAAMQTAERLRMLIHNLHVQWRQHNLHTGVSIGVVHIHPQRPTDAQTLLRMAESACKHAKESGRNRISVYNPFNRVFQRYQGDMEWVQRLRFSLEHDKFTLMAQTVYPLQPSVTGMHGAHFEILLRLQDGPDKLILPNEFIPIAERYDLMPQIDRWVVRNSLILLKQRLAEGADICTCSINLSGSGLGDSELLEFIRQNIQEHGIAADKLCFEITETTAIASMDLAIAMIEELRKLGCRFSLDDFGSGMASFKYLQQLPVDYLKIDGSFVKDMLQNPCNRAMVDSINHIGHVMGKKTIAEFVADDATFKALQDMGVDYAQGYHIARPVPFDAAYFRKPPRVQTDSAVDQ